MRPILHAAFASAALLALLGCGGAEPASNSTRVSEADGATEVSDALAPTTTDADARTKQLHTVTLVTSDLAAVQRYFVDHMGLTLSGPIDDGETRTAQAKLWGLESTEKWQLYLLRRPSVPGTVQIRVVVVSEETPAIHTDWDPLELGPFSLGFPANDIRDWDAELRAAGYTSRNEMESYQVPRPDGTRYGIDETIFKGPEFLHTVLISRGDGMPQLGPVDVVTGRGGPVYSAMTVPDSEAFVEGFLVDVLGLELRSDREWTSAGRDGALNVPDGTKFRFAIVYAHGARFGHLLILEFRGGEGYNGPGVAFQPPNRGLVMWSFPVTSIEDTLARVRASGIEGVRVVAGPVELRSEALGHVTVATVTAPNGFLVELFEPAA